MRRVMMYAAILLTGCASAPPSPSVSPSRGDRAREIEVAGRALARHGRHLEASRYLEAAVSLGANEKDVLPLLIAVQIRADRIRAAKLNAIRLREIIGSGEALNALIQLLDHYTPAVEAGRNEEVLK